MRYIQSELYRLKKTPPFRYLMIASVVIILIFMVASAVFIEPEISTEYLEIMAAFSIFASFLVDGIATTIINKTKDTKIQILTYGITREEMYIKDFISYHLYIAITVILLFILSIVSGKILELTGVMKLGDIKDYLETIIQLSILNFCLASAIYGLTVITNNAALGIFGQIILIPLALGILVNIAPNGGLKDGILAVYNLQPVSLYDRFLGYGLLPVMKVEILKSLAFILVAYLLPGLLVFKKREIY